MAHKQARRTTFFDLPAELRNPIYELLVVEDGPIRIPYHANRTTVDRPSEPALLAVNRQIRIESRGVFYGVNIFRASGFESAAQTLMKLNVFQLKPIRRLEINMSPCPLSASDLKREIYVWGCLWEKGFRKDAIFYRCLLAGIPEWKALYQAK